MHARHRSPGNGYRSNSVGMGMGGSRISPENSGRGHGFYNSEYRSFNNRGFGRGQFQPRTSQQPPQPPLRKGDIMMEAGRLAVEYLVSKGMLPQSALSGKWQNGGVKKQFGEYQEFRQQEDNAQEGRTPSHSRLGASGSDGGFGRRRYSDEFTSRSSFKGRRRSDYYRSYSSEWGREYGRSGSWSDRNRILLEGDGESDTTSSLFEEQQCNKAVGNDLQKSERSDFTSENPNTNVESEMEKHNFPVEMNSKASSSAARKEDPERETSDESDEAMNSNLGSGDTTNGENSCETEKHVVQEDIPNEKSSADPELSLKSGSDLLTLCNFVKVPTKTRSALTYGAPKGDHVPKVDEENVSDRMLHQTSNALVQERTLKDTGTIIDGHANTTNSPLCTGTEDRKALSIKSGEDTGELGLAYGTGQGNCVRTHSFPDRTIVHDNELESRQGPHSFGRSISVKEEAVKRPAEENDMDEPAKKPREWLPASGSKIDDFSHLAHFSNLNVYGESSRQERASSDQQVVKPVTIEYMVEICQLPKNGGEPSLSYAQEKQLFPSSFKICDLNLMEVADMNDSHRNDAASVYSSVMTAPKEPSQVDVDLSISNANESGEFRRTSDSKDIEIIDLENDSPLEDKAFDNSQRKAEIAFGCAEGFSSNAQNSGGIADVHDNYDGLMISEFLNSFPNCTSVTGDINPLQNDIGLRNGEVLYLIGSSQRHKSMRSPFNMKFFCLPEEHHLASHQNWFKLSHEEIMMLKYAAEILVESYG